MGYQHVFGMRLERIANEVVVGSSPITRTQETFFGKMSARGTFGGVRIAFLTVVFARIFIR